MFASRNIEQELNVKEAKPTIVNEGHLHNRAKGHKQQFSAIVKHHKNVHGTIPQDLLKRFEVPKKCRNKIDCLVYEMLFIRTLKLNLNVQSDSIRAKVFS